MNLEGKRFLVTGGSGGIGRAIATALLGAGAEVFSSDRPGVPPPEGTTSLECDLADQTSRLALIQNLSSRAEELDGFIHAAGVTRDGVLWKMSPEKWGEVLEVNLTSAFHLLQGLVPLLRKRGEGSVVLISSINGERGKFGQSNYAASKAGLIGLGRSAARELGEFGIRVNSVAPGMIRTEMTVGLPEEFKERAKEESALKRIGEPEDVAGAVLFLCSNLSRHVTGQVLRVDGGQLMG